LWTRLFPAYGMYSLAKSGITSLAKKERITPRSLVEDRSYTEIDKFRETVTSPEFVKGFQSVAKGFNQALHSLPGLPSFLKKESESAVNQAIDQMSPEQVAIATELGIDIPAIFSISKLQNIAMRAINSAVKEGISKEGYSIAKERVTSFVKGRDPKMGAKDVETTVDRLMAYAQREGKWSQEFVDKVFKDASKRYWKKSLLDPLLSERGVTLTPGRFYMPNNKKELIDRITHLDPAKKVAEALLTTKSIPDLQQLLSKAQASAQSVFNKYKVNLTSSGPDLPNEWDISKKGVKAHLTDVSEDEGPGSLLINEIESHVKGAGRTLVGDLQRTSNKLFLDAETEAGKKMAEDLGFKQIIPPEESTYPYGSWMWESPLAKYKTPAEPPKGGGLPAKKVKGVIRKATGMEKEATPKISRKTTTLGEPLPTTKQLPWKFLEQEKQALKITNYFTPAEYQMETLGFKEFIHKPIRSALQDFAIEYESKLKYLEKIKTKYPNVKNDIVYKYMDKGIPQGTTPEILKAKEYRVETNEMLKRMNEVRKIEGKPPVKGLQNYILHALQPEVLSEIYEKGVIPLELAKVMEKIPPHTVFLRTAQARKGVPADWLIKDPDKLMQMMYAIDLRYIHLQKALKKVQPYLEAVEKFPGDEIRGVKPWSDLSYKYVDSWVKQAIKMRPSDLDKQIDNLIEHTLAPILRNRGIKVSHMPWRDFVGLMSAMAHTGALGMRVKPILRNLVQSSFDYVMYGTKNYFKGSVKFTTPEGQRILKQSKVWQTRVPYEAQEKAMLGKVFRAGSIAYRFSDLHNVGKALLTRYYFARDTLKMNHQEALDWSDNDLPSTQWSYRREDLPRAYWSTTGRAFWTLGSWWMNYYGRFAPEVIRRTFTGYASDGRKVTPTEKMAGLRWLILGAVLYGMKKATRGVVDYTGQVLPSLLREAPTMQLGRALVDVYNGLSSGNDYQLKEGLRNVSRTSKVFIPYYLAGEELWKFLKGDKTMGEFLFYSKKKKPKSRRAVSRRRSSRRRRRRR